MTFNDKHQMQLDNKEFTRTSYEFTIHPKYDQAAGNNYDLCLGWFSNKTILFTEEA